MKIKKVLKIIFWIFVCFLLWQIIVSIIFWRPFIQERLAFDMESKDSQTRIINNNFAIEFSIKDSCSIDSEIMEQFSTDYTWGGNFWCDSYDDYVALFISDNDIDNVDDYNKLENTDRIFQWQTEEGVWNIIILNKERNKK